PELDQRQLLGRQRLFQLGRHLRLLRLAGQLDQQAVCRFSRDNGLAALAPPDEVVVGTQVELRLLDRPAMAGDALLVKDRFHILGVGNRFFPFQLDDLDRLNARGLFFLGEYKSRQESNQAESKGGTHASLRTWVSSQDTAIYRFALAPTTISFLLDYI